LALALGLYVEVEVEPAQRLVVRAEGEGADLEDEAGHLAARVAIDVVGHDRLAITVRSEIPVARGLGSSAALAVAAAAAAGSKDPLGVAARVDGHPENAAASVVGGLVGATMVKGAVRAVRLPLDSSLSFVVAVPDRSLPTTKARQALPHDVSRADATFNLGRMALLLAGLADRSLLIREATEDRLHQDYRSPLFPEAPQLLNRLLHAGASAVCWSGAGSSMLGICDSSTAEKVRVASEAAMEEIGVPGKALLLRADLEGLRTDRGRVAGPSAAGPYDVLAEGPDPG
jgi:homoserine kinase